MKLENLKQELAFIRSATEKYLFSHIKAKRLTHVVAEKELIKRDLTDVLVSYIQKYGLRSSARIAIFRSNKQSLIKLLLSQEYEHQTILTEFLEHGNYHTIWLYLTGTDEDTSNLFPEESLIAAHNVPELHQRAIKKQLTPFAQYNIIRNGFNLGLTETIIRSCKLNEREKMAVMEYGEWEQVNLLIEYEKNPCQQGVLNEMKMIRFFSDKKIEKQMLNKRFSKNAERFFFRHGSFSLLVRYIKHYDIEDGHEVLIKRAGPTEILGYLSKNWLCEKGEKLLLDRRKHREIKAYIKGHYFTEDNETRFIKRGRHSEIMLYISRHSLCDTAQQELMYRRHAGEIEYYVTHYPLADIAEKAFLKCANSEIIRTWQENPSCMEGICS